MKTKQFIIGLLVIGFNSCNSNTEKTKSNQESYANVQVAGAMKNVMQKGELAGVINLDTIKNKKGLYGIGPESYLTGEILINDGNAYVSRVLSDSTMKVEKTFNTSAPFFVYANVDKWERIDLPKNIATINDLETFISANTLTAKRPFAFKLIGQVATAQIHIQNLPENTKVSSPEEAHQGQTDYLLRNIEVEIIGFFSTDHKGVFTHHDSNVHMHLITIDRNIMGHLDNVSVEDGTMKLYLPN